MEKMEKKAEVLAKKQYGIFQVAEATTFVIESKTGVHFVDLCSRINRDKFHKGRVLFAGILDYYGIPSGKIAQLIYKKTDLVKAFICEYKCKLKTSNEFQQIAKEAINRVKGV